MAQFKLGKGSLRELDGIHPDLVAVVKRAIEITVQDFTVTKGIRTLEEQQEKVDEKTSKTLISRHLTGHAVDLVPYVNGKLQWEWDPIYDIADAVRTAANELDIPIRWGGAWDILLTDFDNPPKELVAGYSVRRRQKGKSVFLDGPHYELPKSQYP